MEGEAMEMTTQEKINQAYLNIQNLQYQPTEHNVMLAANIFMMLKQAHQEVTMLAQALQEAQKRVQELENAANAEPEEESDGMCYTPSEDALDGNPPAVNEDEI